MVTDNKLLLCIDGSDQAMEAVKYIGKIMAARKMNLVLFHIMKNTSGTVLYPKYPEHDFIKHGTIDVPLRKKSKDNISDKIHEAKQILIKSGIPEKQIQVKPKKQKTGLAMDIAAEARKGYSAVVVGRKGLRKIKHLLFGGTPFKLMAVLNNIPLCIVGGSPETRKFLLALNASDSSLAAAKKASSLLKNPSLEVYMLNVLKGYDPFDPNEIIEYKDRIRERERIMQEVFKDAKTFFINAGMTKDRITSGIITNANRHAETIIEKSRKNNCGSIIVGTNDRIKRNDFMGSVSHRVVSLAGENAVWVMN